MCRHRAGIVALSGHTVLSEGTILLVRGHGSVFAQSSGVKITNVFVIQASDGIASNNLRSLGRPNFNAVSESADVKGKKDASFTFV